MWEKGLEVALPWGTNDFLKQKTGENWGWGRAVGGNYEFCLREIHSKNVKKAIGLVLVFCIRIDMLVVVCCKLISAM